MNKIPVKIKLLRPEAQVPEYAKEGDSGFDLRACIDSPWNLHPGCQLTIPTGIAIQILDPYKELQVRSRSGLGHKNGIAVLLGIGTVDNGYRNEVGVILINHSKKLFVINHGDRIAQGVIAPVYRAVFEVVEELDETERGMGGFGHSGVR